MEISLYRRKNLYFAVGVLKSDDKVVKSTIPKSKQEEVIEEIKDPYYSFEISKKYRKLAKELWMAYNGEKVHFNINLNGVTAFERKVLSEVMRIPHGEVRTYKNIAEAVGSKAYRAVGTALNRNPLPIIIPCHRVVRSDLSIGGYKGGMEMKKEILENEGLCIFNNKIILRNK